MLQVRASLDRLAVRLSTADLSARHWPEYGALLTNLRNVVEAMARVAAANPVAVSRYAERAERLRLPVTGPGRVRGRRAGSSTAPPRRSR